MVQSPASSVPQPHSRLLTVLRSQFRLGHYSSVPSRPMSAGSAATSASTPSAALLLLYREVIGLEPQLGAPKRRPNQRCC